MKKVKLNAIEFGELVRYVMQCFSVQINVTSQTLLDLLNFHLNEIREKLHRKALDFAYQDKQTVRVKFTEGELTCLSFLFNQVKSEGLMVAIETKLLEVL